MEDINRSPVSCIPTSALHPARPSLDISNLSAFSDTQYSTDALINSTAALLEDTVLGVAGTEIIDQFLDTSGTAVPSPPTHQSSEPTLRINPQVLKVKNPGNSEEEVVVEKIPREEGEKRGEERKDESSSSLLLTPETKRRSVNNRWVWVS